MKFFLYILDMDTTRTNVFINTELKGDLAEDIKLHTLCERYPYARFFIIAGEEYFYRFKWLLNLVLISPREDGSYRIIKEMQPLRIGLFARRVKDKYVEGLRTLSDSEEIKSSLLDRCDLVIDISDWGTEPLYLASMPAIPEKIKKAVVVPCPDIPDMASSYVHNMSSEISSLLADGYSVSMQSFCHLDGSESVMQKIMDSLPEEESPNVFCTVYEKDMDVLLREFAEAEKAIVSRPEAEIIAGLCGCEVSVLDPFTGAKQPAPLPQLPASDENSLSSPCSPDNSSAAEEFFSEFDPLLSL